MGNPIYPTAEQLLQLRYFKLKISDLRPRELRRFCEAMAYCGKEETKDPAYSNLLDALGIQEPPGFNYIGDEESILYSEVEDIVTKVIFINLIFDARYYPDHFQMHAKENKGFEFALWKLSELKYVSSWKDFDYFCERLTEEC